MKVGVYVDVANLSANGAYGMRYEILRDFAARGATEPIRLNAYVVYDERRADDDPDYRRGQERFYSTLREYGYKVIVKQFKWYRDDTGREYAKANADLDMAVDALLQSENLDRVLIATGDGDFVQVVRALQNRGCRVEVVAFNSISADLRREADFFLNGYLIPSLTPPVVPNETPRAWGADGSRVRGVCHTFLHDKKYGFVRFLRNFGGGLWHLDTRHEQSPWSSAFVLKTDFRDFDTGLLPSHDYIFEFTYTETPKGGQARDLALVSPYFASSGARPNGGTRQPVSSGVDAPSE